MYEDHYGIRARPFLTVPDAEFMYWSSAHELAYTILRYGLTTRAPITVVTGEIGSGKTTLLRHLMTELPEEVTVGLISNMQAGRGELLHWVMMALGESFIAEEPYVALFKRFQETVIAAYARGKRVVLIFDEAQNLSVSALEELRMLSNINADKDELLQIVLVGQPQLRDLLARPELVQFSQRIAADFNLEPLNAQETEAYIQHRLELVGAQWRIFPSRTCALIYEATRGIPRLVNILCDVLMVYGYAADSKVIEEPLLREFLSAAARRGIYTQFSLLQEPPVSLHSIR